jgi:hypothetical protein
MNDLRRIIWLASFPKSGNTWIRSLLAQYFMPPGQAPDLNNLRNFTTGDVRRDFFDAAAGGRYDGSTIADWLEMRPRALRLIAGSKPTHHFVKTHCQTMRVGDTDLIPPEVTAAAIYIMRNPFDLAPSFARHQACDLDTAIDRMMNPDSMAGTAEGIFEPLGRWDDHVTSWTTAPGLSRHVLRYEDMIANTGKAMRGLIETFFRISVDKPKLARAVRATNFDAMKAFEQKHGFVEKPAEMRAFFAKGQAGVWRDDLSPAQVGRIREAFLPVLEKWYPEMLKETAVVAGAA